ncbi:cytochrome c oxidase assembly protein [bacterium LRH843]|nr:cytochrome c oxidase assembly protein [bacterium LRH843]
MVSQAKNNSTLKPLIKIVYIVGMGALMTPLATYIIYMNNVLYSSYASLPRLFDFPLLSDQQLGGVVMKVMQIIVYCIMIVYCFSEAVRLDRNQDEVSTDDLLVDKS